MIEVPVRPRRRFLSEEFTVTGFDAIRVHTDRLLERAIPDAHALREWLLDRSELESVLSEDLGWRYIRMTCQTDNASYQQDYQDFVENIQPHLSLVSDKLNRKALDCPALRDLEAEEGYDLMIRSMRKEVEIFREENVPLFTEISTLAQEYARISGAMTVEIDGKELTLQQAAVILQETDRNRREMAWRKVAERRLQDSAALDELFTKMVKLRHRIAVNAGFANFRDYMFKALGRFDYTPQDCFDFHASVASEVVPLLNRLAQERRGQLGVEMLRPWDKAVDAAGRQPLKAFDGGKDLLERSINTFHRLDSYLGNCLTIMKEMGHLDLESRKGKAPGGYNYPLAEIGVPFIFMNATSTLRDLTTLMHEGGHAVHNFLTRDLALNEFKSPPMEVAELASMSMELLTMDQWDEFFSDPNDLRRARLEQLEDIVETLPWVATIDRFQHWIYEHPDHTAEERRTAWREVAATYGDKITDWSGLDNALDFLWQKQLHLYEVPFYYIEYGMAQLGAVGIWRNYRIDPAGALEGYKKALSLGNLRGIPAIYSAAGIRFSFSREYIRELTGFISVELDSIRD